MRNHFDAIIVGSGLGGLTSGASLAKNGYRVAVFERHSQPGGYATSFFRDSFEFEVSLHAMSGVGTRENPGPLFPFFDALGILDRVHFIPMHDLYRTIAGDVDITVPKSAAKAKAVLVGAFPHEAEGIAAFIDHIMVVGEEVQLIREGNHGTAPLPTVAKFPSLAHAAGTTVSDVLDPLVEDDTVKLVLAQLWGYFGLPPSKLSFLLFAAGVSSYLKWGSVTVEGKSQSLSNAYAEVIRENGGEVYLSNGVRKILVEDGRVVGVLSESGETYHAGTVISNADPFSTLTRLIDGEHVAPKYVRRLEAAEPSIGSVTLYLGLNRPSREVGIDDHELYINLDTDMDIQWEKCTTLSAPGVVSVCAYDNSNPAFAPSGKGVLAITLLHKGEVWTTMDDNVYAMEKERFGDMLLAIVENHFPGVAAAIETKVVSTPVTNVRYTGNPQGAIYGFANTPEENPGFRPSNRGPVDGLWFAGAWTRPSAGYQGVITSGFNTAKDIIQSWGEVNTLPYGVNPEGFTGERPMQRRLKGWKLLLRDGKRVGKVIRSKYRKYDNAPLATDYVSPYDKSSRYHAQNLQMKVVARTVETFDTVTLRLFSKDNARLNFRAGQYVDVSAEIRGEQITRAYSISSAPRGSEHIDITVKAQSGGKMSTWLVDDVSVGDRLTVTGPFGEFVYVPQRDTNDMVAIAVGSGITPLMSILRQYDGAENGPNIHLIYGSRRESEIIFKEELRLICSRNANIKVTHILSQPSRFWAGYRGRVTSRKVLSILNERVDRKTFFICGPSRMYRPLIKTLRQYRVPESQIRFESFRNTTAPVPAVFDRYSAPALQEVITANAAYSAARMCHLAENPILQSNRPKQNVFSLQA